jgi:hypothetical protein
MPRLSINIKRAELERLSKLSEQFSGLSLAAKLHRSRSLAAETALEHFKKFEGIHIQTINRIRKDRELLRKTLTSPVLEMATQFEEQSQQLGKLFNSTAFQAFREIEELNRSFREAIMASSSLAFHAANALQNQIKFVNLASLNSIASAISKLSAQTDVYQQLQDSFSVKLVRELEKEGPTPAEAIKTVEKALTEKAKNLPPSRISLEGMIQLLFAFIFFIYATISSMESEERIIGEFKQIETTILEQIEKLTPQQDTGTYYVVKRAVNLRTKPTTKSPVITILYPNQKVELIQRKGKWIYVNYFDYVEGLPKTGWAYKKYLKIVK